MFPVVLVLGVIMLILAYSLVFLAHSENKLTNRYVEYMQAEQIADAGVEQALFYLKSHAGLNEQLVRALEAGTEEEFTFPDELYEEIQKLSSSARHELKLQVRLEPTTPAWPGQGVYTGNLRILSTGTVWNRANQVFSRQIDAVYASKAMYMGIIAPDHGLFIREKEHMNYRFEDSIEPSDLRVLNGDVYVKNGITAELSDYITRKMIEKGELTWEEYYYMDHPPKSTGLMDGGVDFLESDRVEYERYGVFRKFNMFGQEMPPEPYARNVHASLGFWTDEQIHLRPPQFYRDMASLVIEPTIYSSLSGNSRDNSYFRDIVFEGERGYNSIRYSKVMPLYGYGDWRRAPIIDPTRYGPRSRKHDMSNPIQIDGIVYVKGDVFLEGWYEGIGMLVVQGNVYLGGSLRALPTDTAGHPSLLNVIVFEDPSREGGFTMTDHDSFKATGKIIMKPHPDNDWSEQGGQDPDPNLRMDAAVYAQNGMKKDLEAWRDNWADLGNLNVDMKHNFVTETVNMNFLPHDIIIYGKNPDDEFLEAGGSGLNDFLQTDISVMLSSWSVQTVQGEADEAAHGE